MDWEIDVLQPFVEENIALQELLPVFPRFHVPRLPDKPQNPIIETLRLSRTSARKNGGSSLSPLRENNKVAEDSARSSPVGVATPDEDVWQDVIHRSVPGLVRRLSLQLCM